MKFNSSPFKFGMIFALVCTLASAAFGQTTTTGEVVGVVSDPNGAVVPNVTVTLSGPNLIRPLTVTSDSDGSFRLGSVPPGRYTLETSSAAGFAPYKVENVEVNLGRTTTANVALSAAGATGVVEVTGGTPEIDQSSNTTGANISTEFFSNIPTSRTVQGLYTIAPTVTRSGLRDASGRERDPSVADPILEHRPTREPRGTERPPRPTSWGPDQWVLPVEPPKGIEPLTYSLRVNRSGRLS